MTASHRIVTPPRPAHSCDDQDFESALYYGRNSIPTYGTTNSVYTVPVYGAHTDDPCYDANFASASCMQAWQWNLDEVIDARGNEMVYHYAQHTNYYGADGGTTGVKYTREGWLDHIDYGLAPGLTTAPQRVQFTTGDRCVAASCDPIDSNTANWPDVPWDLNCVSGASCATHTPTFFSTFRLKSIATQVYDFTAKKYVNVDTYSLTQSFPAPKDGNQKPALRLDSILHSGNVGTTTPLDLPKVVFTYQELANRFNIRDGYADLYKFRISGITTESGHKISISYKNPTGCSTSTDLATNTSTCFPVYWTPDGLTDPILDWFDKYVVASVTDNDNTKASASKVTQYDYSGGKPAWHYDDNEVVEAKYRTYGQWRGFSDVKTITGETTDGQTVTDTRYYQGMDGDILPGGKTRSATVALSGDVNVPGTTSAVTDLDQLAGSIREAIAYRSDGGAVANATVNDYWVSGAFATRSRTDLPALTSNLVRQAATTNTSAITSGAITSWRTTHIVYGYDKTRGMLRYTDDQGDTSKPEQETCTTTSYVPFNSTLNLFSLISEVESDKGPCSTGNSSSSNGLGAPSGVSRPTDVISDARTYYDTPAPTSWPPALPDSQPSLTVGSPTLVYQADGYANNAFTYQVKSAEEYDTYGRTTDTWDALGNETTTEYTTVNGETTATKVTNAKGQVTTSTLDVNRGTVTETVDPNGGTTDTTFDPLGRVTGLWLPGRDKATKTANYTYSYNVSQSVPSSVTTKQLMEDGGYTTSVEIFDGMLRPRQTQTQTPQGGRMLTDTFYDSRGLVWKANNGYWNGDSGPTTTLVGDTSNPPVNDTQVTNQVLTTYDGLGRPVMAVSEDKITIKEKVQTVYGGDRVTTIPLTGGTASTTVTDARGRTIETDAYQSTPTVAGDQIIGGSPAATKFTFDASGSHGQNSAITDPGGNTRTYSYDLLGQKISQTDPDTGTTTFGYDAAGNVTSTTDARGKTISTTYDELGRKTAQYDGADSSAPKLADWTYDDPAVPHSVGRVTASTRYDAGGNAFIQAVNGYNIQGEPTKTTTTIPASVPGLAGSYSYFHGYTANVALPMTTTFPAVGNLPSEKVGYGYNSLDMLDSVGGVQTYARDTSFDAYGRVAQMTAGATPTNAAVFTNSYDEHTGALTEANISRTTTPQAVQDTKYTRNPAGDITRVIDNRAGSPTDTQCFAYDGLGRLATAWTATDNCAGAPTTTGSSPTVGGGDSSLTYWTSWTFDVDGNRKTQVQHGISGISADTTTSYTYGKPVDPTKQPDTLTNVQTTQPDGTVTGGVYSYDASGNTASSTLTAGDSTLSWNDQGQLVSSKSSAQSKPTTYSYDADGNQLLRQDPDGKTTLYLPDQEVVYDPSLPAGSNVTATRYVALPGGVTCVRTGAADGAYTFVAANDQATGTTSLTSTDQTPTFRLMDPYGNPRGTQPGSWPGDRGFVGGTQDTNTGLTHLGAREYDPTLGRFISADPLFEATDPNQIGGYAYAGDNPVTGSDPTGLMNKDSGGGSPDDTLPPASDCPPRCTPDGIAHGPSTGAPGSSGDLGKPDNSGTGSGSSGGSSGTGGDSGTVMVYPTIVVPSNWDRLQAFQRALYESVKKTCYSGDIFCLAPLDESDPDSARLNPISSMELESSVHWACEEVGGCPKSVDSLWKFVQAMMTASALADHGGGADTAGAGCRLSFSPATRVLMKDGKSKPIGDLKPGDQVESANPTDGKHEGLRTVTARLVHHDDDLIDLTIRTNGGSTQTIHTTSKHPFWDDTLHAWIPAAQLVPGHTLETDRNGHVWVAVVRYASGAADMFNLTVDQTHTYYVLAGSTPVLVHNTCPTFKTGKPISGPLPDAGQTSLYALIQPRTGKLLKWGISKNPVGRYSGTEYENGTQMRILRNYDSRQDALDAERYMTERHPGPLNLEPHAGSVDPTQSWEEDLRYVTGGRFFADRDGG